MFHILHVGFTCEMLRVMMSWQGLLVRDEDKIIHIHTPWCKNWCKKSSNFQALVRRTHAECRSEEALLLPLCVGVRSNAQQCAAAPDRISRSLTNLYHSQGSENIMPGLLPRVFWCHFGSKIVSIQNLQFQSVFLQAWSSLPWKHVDFWYNMAITRSWCFCQKFGSIRTSMTMLKTTETMQCRPSPLVSFGCPAQHSIETVLNRCQWCLLHCNTHLHDYKSMAHIDIHGILWRTTSCLSVRFKDPVDNNAATQWHFQHIFPGRWSYQSHCGDAPWHTAVSQWKPVNHTGAGSNCISSELFLDPELIWAMRKTS